MKTTVEELPESKVRLQVEVPEADVRHAFEHAASELAKDMRIPGFRKGKAPLQVVAARVGREALSVEAVRSHIDGWFWDAAASSGIRPVAGPDVEWDELPTQGGTFLFTATVAVAPKPELPDWRKLEVPAADPEVPREQVDAALDELRSSVAELVPVSGRPVRESDTVVVDLDGEEAGSHRDYVSEVGDGRLADEIEEALVGMAEGDTRSVEVELPDGNRTSVAVTVKEIKEKVLPELDDELARAASEFDTLAELRADVEAHLGQQLEAEFELQFRRDALEALVAASKVEGVEPLVERRAAALTQGLVRSLERRGVSVETYLRTTGQTAEQVQERMRAEAERAVEQELVLEAVADQLGIEVSDEEVEELFREEAAVTGNDPQHALERFKQGGGYGQLREDLRLKKALDEVMLEVKRIPLELARARERLWTPEKEKGGTGMKIWTPGSEEPR